MYSFLGINLINLYISLATIKGFHVWALLKVCSKLVDITFISVALIIMIPGISIYF